MAQNKTFRFGPIALTATLTTNLLNPPTATGGVNSGSSPNYLILKHLRIVNKTAGAVTFSLWLGATGGTPQERKSSASAIRWRQIRPLTGTGSCAWTRQISWWAGPAPGPA